MPVCQIELPPGWTRNDEHPQVTVLDNRQIESVITVAVVPVQARKLKDTTAITAALQRIMPKTEDLTVHRYAENGVEFQGQTGPFRIRGQARLVQGVMHIICAEFPARHADILWPELEGLIKSIRWSS